MQWTGSKHFLHGLFCYIKNGAFSAFKVLLCPPGTRRHGLIIVRWQRSASYRVSDGRFTGHWLGQDGFHVTVTVFTMILGQNGSSHCTADIVKDLFISSQVAHAYVNQQGPEFLFSFINGWNFLFLYFFYCIYLYVIHTHLYYPTGRFQCSPVKWQWDLEQHDWEEQTACSESEQCCVIGHAWLTCICNVMWRSAAVPPDRQTGVVVPIFSKGDHCHLWLCDR